MEILPEIVLVATSCEVKCQHPHIKEYAKYPVQCTEYTAGSTLFLCSSMAARDNDALDHA
jgi:hypothetical protein